MGPISSIIAWVAFGLVAGIVAMILPFHRGVRGIALNLAIGVVGALAGGFLGRLLRVYPDITHSFSFLLASVGAVVLLGGFHAYWSYAHSHAHSRVRTPHRRDF